MSRNRALALLPCLGALAVGCGGGGEDGYDSFATLSAALATAAPGDVIRVRATTIAGGAVDVPAGVTLSGSGPGGTTVVAPDGESAIIVHTAEGMTTTVRGLSVETAGTAGLVIGGAGAAVLEDIEVSATRGIGVGAEGLPMLSMSRVTVVGPVTPDNADGQPLNPTPAETATHGIVLVNVARATLMDVRADGFGLFGALLVDSGVEWTGGGVHDNLSTGLMAYGGTFTADTIEAMTTLQGLRLLPAYGVVLAQGVAADTVGLVMADGQGYGLLQTDSAGSHRDLVATSNSNAALYVQRSAGFHVEGTGTRIMDNNFAGIAVVDSTDVSIADATIGGTMKVTRVVGDGTVEVGDGVQAVRSPVSCSGLTLTGNERTGLLAELGGGSTADLSIGSVTVEASGDAFGVVVQNGTVEPGWDSGVTRMGSAEMNDTAFLASSSVLDVVGVVAPTDFPRGDDLASGGLGSVGVVAPTD